MLPLLLQAGEVNFTAIPDQLLERLLLNNIFEARLIAVLLIMLITIIPVIVFTQSVLVISIIISIDIMLFSTIGWLEGYVVILLCMLIAGLWSTGIVKDMLGGE